MVEKTSTTRIQASKSINGNTTRKNIIRIQNASLELLIGGPYTDIRGERHTYGHVALRIIKSNSEHIYDFGRYAGATGDFGAEGPGILRIWSGLPQYIAGENSTGRQTHGFSYQITDQQADQVNMYYKNITQGLPITKERGEYMKEYRLTRNYHALTNNCTTISMDGALIAIPELAHDQANFNEGRGLSFTEKAAAKLKGWPSRIFMPADLKAMLESTDKQKPYLTQTYGNNK
ncbi:hypothetical protein [Azonexus sp.]|jgi:hypothetical protein|uniref:hypothetical protein n=1 Tax=Azonexus sp. TaxID=1872668 RepID=UPI00281DC728|nr:hypothetical protein [Azonexus sp.]MDR1994174.1 hypothetical protein [Azonexus sp.]